MKWRSMYILIFVLCSIIMSTRRWKYSVLSTYHVPLWYDPGLYRAISLVYTNRFDHINQISSFVRPRRLHHEPLWGITSAVLARIGISIDRQLKWGRYWISIISLLTIFFRTRYTTRNTLISLWVATLISLSVIQREAWNMMYYKQIIAQVIGFIILVMYQRRQYHILSLLLFWIMWLHRHTSLFFFLIIISGIVSHYYQYRQFDKKLLLSIAIGIGCGMMRYLPMFQKLILQYLYQIVQSTDGSGPQGLFFTMPEYISFSLPWILGGIWYLIHQWKHEKTTLYRWVFLWLVRIATGFINAHRQEILTDPFLIIASISILREYYKRYPKSIIVISLWLLIRQSSYFLGYTTETKPLLSEKTFNTIQEIKTILPTDATIMIDDSAYTPRIMWYTERNRISPWLSDANKRNLGQRTTRRLNVSWDKRCTIITQDYQNYITKWLYFWSTHSCPSQNPPCGDIIMKDNESCLIHIK